MTIREMPRGQLEAVARRLGIRNPQCYLLPDLRGAVRARYHAKKSATPKP